MTFNALSTATAGLRATQASIAVVSQNVANVGTTGYVKRALSSVADGPGNSGVATGTISRALDAAAQKQLRLETSGAAYTGTVAETRTQLDKLYGSPGSATALDGVMNAFAQSLQGLAADPTSPPARSTVIERASTLANTIAGIADGVQELRTATEMQLSNDTVEANGYLKAIGALNAKISATNDPSARADLLDQRDQKLTGLSFFMDIQTVPQRDGSVSVLTGSGVTLVERNIVATLSFDGRSTLSPDAAYTADPATRGVGTITATTSGGAKIDMIASGAIRSGSLAAGIELRDTILPQAQSQLDDLAAGLSRAMSDRAAEGTAVTAGPAKGFDIDLTGLRAGNAITLSLRDAAGNQRNLILVPSKQMPAPNLTPADTVDPSSDVISFTLPPESGDASVAETLHRLLQPTYSVTAQPSAGSGGLRILSNGAPGDPTILSIRSSVTQATSTTDIQNGQPQLPLFIDGKQKGSLYTGSFDGGAQSVGFAQRIKVNPSVIAITSSLVNLSATTQTGDTTRADYLYGALTNASRTFSASSGIGGVEAPYAATVQDFAQRIVDAQGAGAASAKDLDEGQAIALATAQSRFATQSGVNIDEEMSNLIALQTAYGANARVLTAARDMLDTLLRI